MRARSALPPVPGLALALIGCALLTAPGAGSASEPGRHVQADLDGRTLNGWLTEVDDARATIIMLHGTLAHANMEIMTTLADVFAEYGIETLRVTLSLGVDDREGMMDCAITQRHAHADAIEELAVWFRWLRESGRESVVLLGHSRGTNQIMRYAIRPDLPAPTALVLVAPTLWDAESVARGYGTEGTPALATLLEQAQARVAAGHGEEILGRVPFLHCGEAQVTADAFLSYYSDDPAFDTPGLIARAGLPVLVLAGSEDPLTESVGAAVAALPDAGQVEFVLIDGADHFFRDLYAYDLVETVVPWLEARINR